MKQFIEALYDYYLNNHPLPEIYVKEDGKPYLDNVYVKALFDDFQGTRMPTRRSDLEEIAYTVCYILDCLPAVTGRDFYPNDTDSVNFYIALCHCLYHIDRETARYSYDYEPNYDLNRFYSICKDYGINYCRLIFCNYSLNIGGYRQCSGFRQVYLDSLLEEDWLTESAIMTYFDAILISDYYGPNRQEYKIEDWLKDSKVKRIWNKLPFDYIRDNYRDEDYYDKLKDRQQLQLFAMCVEAVKKECEELWVDKISYIDIEKALAKPSFISIKLNEAFKILKDPNLTDTEMIDEFLDKRPKVKELLAVFKDYRVTLKTHILSRKQKLTKDK